MAYRIEDTDIVIDGWDQGVSNNPYKGINDMRGVNIVSIPGEVSVSFSQTNKTFSNWTGNVVSADAGADTITITTSTGIAPNISGIAVTFTGASLPTGITAGTVYWLVRIDSVTYQLYTDPRLDNSKLVNITASGTGTFASINIGEATYIEKSSGVLLDKNGRTWDALTTAGTYQYLGNPVSGTAGLSATVGNGIIWYKGYLFVFYNSRICYTPYIITGGTFNAQTWVNEWNPTTGTVSVGTNVFNSTTTDNNPHEAIVSPTTGTGTVYITDSHYIAILQEVPGQTFDPTNTATYTWSNKILPLPSNDITTCLTVLGTKLLIGGQTNLIYSWDTIGTNIDPIYIAENGTVHMITVNTNAYIFAGRRGRIYVTNGSQAQQYAKLPDHLSGIEPAFTWKNCAYNKNQIYFGVSATNNAGSDISSIYSGLWAIDITTNALRIATVQSTTGSTPTAVYANMSSITGFGLVVAWKNGSNYGVDIGNSTPYTDYNTSIDTDIIPIGQYLNKRTLNNIEFKLSAPLKNGEGIKLSQRASISDSYTLIGEVTYSASENNLSLFLLPNFDLQQWLQLRIEMKGIASNSSFVRLYELRLR